MHALMAGNGEISNLRQIFQSSIVWLGEAYMRRRLTTHVPADYEQKIFNLFTMSWMGIDAVFLRENRVVR